MTQFFIKIIEIYQKWASPDHSSWGKLRFPNGYCQYYPSCSEYAKQSLTKFGILGLVFGIYRVLRCNPFSKGGFDPVIKTNP